MYTEIKSGLLAGVLTILPLFIANLPIDFMPFSRILKVVTLLAIYILAYYLLLPEENK